jgi:predicted MFS family arabinose efflux permease
MSSRQVAAERVLAPPIIYENESPRRAPVFLLAFCVSLSTAIALGFGRFGYSLVLPAMRADLGWSYSQAGALNTGNALGYLLGALCAAPILQRTSLRLGVLGGLILSVAALFLTSISRDFSVLIFCRALVGFSGALTFISAASLGLRLGCDAAENALAAGIIIAGPGVGVIASGIFIPFLVRESAREWPRAWLLMAALGVLVCIVVAFATRGLQSREAVPEETDVDKNQRFSLRPLLPILIAYFLYGVSYIAYMTFLIAYVRGLEGGASEVTPIWAALGAAMLASSVFWKNALARDRGGRVLTMMAVGGAFSAAIPLVSVSLPALLISATGFGLCSMPVFSVVSIAIRNHLPRAFWSRAVALSTVIFAIGQSLGPLGSGVMSDHFGLHASLVWTAAIMSVAAIVAWLQKPAAQKFSISPPNLS